MISGSGQWMVDLLDYLKMKYPISLISVLFGSIICTFCPIFVMVLYSYFIVIFSGFLNV